MYIKAITPVTIARRTYPIAYNKWIREQVEDIFAEPALYRQLTHLLEIKHFESAEIAQKALEVEALFEQYALAPWGWSRSYRWR